MENLVGNAVGNLAGNAGGNSVENLVGNAVRQVEGKNLFKKGSDWWKFSIWNRVMGS